MDDPHGSIGALRVRESFNPSKDDMVDKIKRYTADLIDLCEELKSLDPRLAAIAQTEYESACHWAVGRQSFPNQVNLRFVGDASATRQRHRLPRLTWVPLPVAAALHSANAGKLLPSMRSEEPEGRERNPTERRG